MKTVTFTKGSAVHRAFCLIAEIPSTYTELHAEMEIDRDALNKTLAELRKRGACMRKPMGNCGMQVWVPVPGVSVVVIDRNAWREPVQLTMFVKRGRKPARPLPAKPPKVPRVTLRLQQLLLDV